MTFAPDWTIPPGETLRETLTERRITQSELARRMGLSLKHVNQVVKGRASLSIPFALLLERELGVSAEFWLNLELRHRLFLARYE